MPKLCRTDSDKRGGVLLWWSSFRFPRQPRQETLRHEQEKRLDAWLALTGQTATPTEPVELPLLTGSMLPKIPVGAVLRIGAAPATDCRAGDVVIFLEGDRLLAHRVLLVVKVGPWHWLLEKGDGNATGQWRRHNTVRGRVLGFAVDGQPDQEDPADPDLASSGLRQHLVQYCKTLGGLRTIKPKA
jgi:hypothetical protein